MQTSISHTSNDDGTKPPRITLTPAAVDWVKKRREKLGQPAAALRVGVRGGGCAGYSYVTELTEDAPKSRELVYDFDGVQVFVDERSLAFIEGSVIDAKATLMYQGLKFDNPLEEKSCGCGATFSVKTNA
jgi:iron-sulfur cluster assembly protein